MIGGVKEAVAATFRAHGVPSTVLNVTHISLPQKLPTGCVRVAVRAFPVNPSDLNQIEGTYPSVAYRLSSGDQVPGNEALLEAVEVAEDVSDVSPGDWLLPATSGLGTWRTQFVTPRSTLLSIHGDGVTQEMAATVAVNPCTALRMLSDFVTLQPGDWVLQNGGTSAVGRAVTQIARSMGLRTLSVIRDRPDFDQVAQELKDLGADEVVVPEQLRSDAVASLIKDAPRSPLLALNCVGGRQATDLARLLGRNGTLVTYGAMSRQPLTLPNSLFIFKNISAKGFWMTQWNKEHAILERLAMINKLFDLHRQGQFIPGPFQHTRLSSQDPNAFLQGLCSVIAASESKKQLVHLE